MAISFCRVFHPCGSNGLSSFCSCMKALPDAAWERLTLKSGKLRWAHLADCPSKPSWRLFDCWSNGCNSELNQVCSAMQGMTATARTTSTASSAIRPENWVNGLSSDSMELPEIKFTPQWSIVIHDACGLVWRCLKSSHWKEMKRLRWKGVLASSKLALRPGCLAKALPSNRMGPGYNMPHPDTRDERQTWGI